MSAEGPVVSRSVVAVVQAVVVVVVVSSEGPACAEGYGIGSHSVDMSLLSMV